jgi:hypothetical protein
LDPVTLEPVVNPAMSPAGEPLAQAAAWCCSLLVGRSKQPGSLVKVESTAQHSFHVAGSKLMSAFDTKEKTHIPIHCILKRRQQQLTWLL